MDNTNLFKHSPKELVTDAFITWLIYLLDSKKELREQKNKFFSALLLKENDKNKNVKSVKIVKQKKGKHGRPDIVLNFNMEGKEQTILFENKTWTTTSNSQLSGYKNDYGDIYRYFYLKLAYVNIKEQKLCEINGYDVITSEGLLQAIQKLKPLHPFIEQYAEYLKHTFTLKINELYQRLFDKDDFEVLKNAQGQEIFTSFLYNSLEKRGISELKFKTGSSSGRPWAEVNICSSQVKYNSENREKEIEETIFWRVDIRASKYYVRLNQYTYNPPKDYLPLKKKRLVELRSIAKNLINKDRQLFGGKISNKGKAESEIVIFFEDKNSIKYLLKVLPAFSEEFIKTYKEMNNNA